MRTHTRKTRAPLSQQTRKVENSREPTQCQRVFVVRVRFPLVYVAESGAYQLSLTLAFARTAVVVRSWQLSEHAMRQSGNPRKKLTFADLSPYVPYEAVKEQQADRAELGPASTDAGRGSSPTAVSGLNLSGAGLTRVVLPSTWFFLTELFLQKNALTSLPALLGGLRHLRLLDVSYNNLVSLPLELGLLYELRDLNVSCNRLTELVPDIFGRLCRLESCQHEGNPLVSPPAHVLGGGAYALFRYCCDCMSAIAPPERQLRHVMAERDQAQMMAQGAARVSVLCYNILAEIYATQERHSYCPTWALAWSYRRGRVLAEILSHAADVVCLQEVETQQYHEFFAPNLAAAGYEGVFQAKSRSRSMAGDGGRVDGCAIFWKQSVFVLVEEHVIEFQNEASFRSEEFAGEVRQEFSACVFCFFSSLFD